METSVTPQTLNVSDLGGTTHVPAAGANPPHPLVADLGGITRVPAPEINAPTPLPDSLPAPKIPDNVSLANAVEYSPQFKSAMNKAYIAAGAGQRNAESGFAVDAEGKPGPIQTVEGHEITAHIPTDSTAYVHTHPPRSKGVDRNGPSPGDVEEAKRLKKPLMTADASGLYETDAQGNTTQVFKDLGWLNPKKPK